MAYEPSCGGVLTVHSVRTALRSGGTLATGGILGAAASTLKARSWRLRLSATRRRIDRRARVRLSARLHYRRVISRRGSVRRGRRIVSGALGAAIRKSYITFARVCHRLFHSRPVRLDAPVVPVPSVECLLLDPKNRGTPASRDAAREHERELCGRPSHFTNSTRHRGSSHRRVQPVSPETNALYLWELCRPQRTWDTLAPPCLLPLARVPPGTLARPARRHWP
jgi:hypothetical protein